VKYSSIKQEVSCFKAKTNRRRADYKKVKNKG
jgi:hypothetical protein